jgi:hypothetical protein
MLPRTLDRPAFILFCLKCIFLLVGFVVLGFQLTLKLILSPAGPVVQ